jgi:hypothetical protein
MIFITIHITISIIKVDLNSEKSVVTPVVVVFSEDKELNTLAKTLGMIIESRPARVIDAAIDKSTSVLFSS